MQIGYGWIVDPMGYILVVVCFGFWGYTKRYTRNKRNMYVDRKKMATRGFFVMFLGIFFSLFCVMIGIRYYNVSILDYAVACAVTMALVYMDGWMTEKAVGNKLATETNPVMAGIFRRWGIRKTRYATDFLVACLLAYWAIIGWMIWIALMGVAWIFVDLHNLITLLGIMKTQKLRREVNELEWGIADMHEL